MPIASTGPAREKKSTARPIVSFGVVVGIVVTAQSSSGPIAIAHSHFEPPLSIPPYFVMPASPLPEHAEPRPWDASHRARRSTRGR
jgi:hypothetical protein